MDTLFELNRMPPGYGMPWVGFMLIMLKRILDSGFIFVREASTGMIGNIKATPDVIFITAKGTAFLADLGIHEL